MAANRLRRQLPGTTEIVIVDRDDDHLYQPGLLFVPFGEADPGSLVRPRQRQIRDGVELREDAVDRVEIDARTVFLTSGAEITYDVLVVATGAELYPEETEGLVDPAEGAGIFGFYTLPEATRLHDALRDFERGRIVVAVMDLPIKCPVAPLEFCFLADAFFERRGVRRDVEITYVTPLDAAFTTAIAADRLAGLLTAKHIALVTEFATGRIEPSSKTIVSWDERTVPYDLLIAIPPHGGARYVSRSNGLGDELGFIPTDPNTLQAKVSDCVFAIGDAANLPTSKAGSVTHYEVDTLVENVDRFLAGKPLVGSYDGHANCFIETGGGRALLIDFDYEHEPAPGRFPDPHVGPFPLLAESRLNHLGKLLFESMYWHVLLPGRSFPGGSSHAHASTEPVSSAAKGAS